MKLAECLFEMSKIEQSIGSLYRNFADICSEKLREVVISLSQEEDKHRTELLKLASNVEFANSHISCDIQALVKEQADSLDVIVSYSEKEFFKLALRIEKNSINIYTKLLELFKSGSKEYQIFEELIEQEKRHMVYILSRLYELR